MLLLFYPFNVEFLEYSCRCLRYIKSINILPHKMSPDMCDYFPWRYFVSSRVDEKLRFILSVFTQITHYFVCFHANHALCCLFSRIILSVFTQIAHRFVRLYRKSFIILSGLTKNDALNLVQCVIKLNFVFCVIHRQLTLSSPKRRARAKCYSRRFSRVWNLCPEHSNTARSRL